MNNEQKEYLKNNTMADSSYDNYLSYHAFSNFEKKAIDNDSLFIGCELEVSNTDYIDTLDKNENIKKVRELNYNLFIGEADGSVENGIEFISQPMTLATWKSLDNLKDSFDYLMENDFISDESNCCGLHFHINRDFFENKNEEAINLLWLIFENYKTEFFNFSRRNKFNLTRWASCLSTIDEKALQRYGKINFEYNKSMQFIENSQKTSRYLAINCNNKKTIEFRFIKGTLNYNTFMASLELIYNLCYLVKDILEKGDYKKLLNKDFSYLINYKKHNELTSYFTGRKIKLVNVFKDYTKLLIHLEEIRKNRLIRIETKEIKQIKKNCYRIYKMNKKMDKIYDLKDKIRRNIYDFEEIDGFTLKSELITFLTDFYKILCEYDISNYNSFNDKGKIKSYPEIKETIKQFKGIEKEKILFFEKNKQNIIDSLCEKAILSINSNSAYFSKSTLRNMIILICEVLDFLKKGGF